MEQLFVVEAAQRNVKVIVWTIGRENAKRKAHEWIGNDPDKYVVTPITNPGDRVKLDITLNV